MSSPRPVFYVSDGTGITAVDEKQGQPVIPFPSAEAWERWLAEHHATSAGVWVKMAKKASGIESVTHVEALDVALCYGWIDGQARRRDAPAIP